MPHRPAVFLSGRKRSDRANDGRCRDSIAILPKALSDMTLKPSHSIVRSLALLLSSLVISHIRVAAGERGPEQIGQVFAGLESTRAPGAAVLVLKDGRVVFERGYGVSDLRSLR